MKIVLTGEESLRIEPTPGQLSIESASPDQSYSPFHMLGSALGMCTFSVLQSWASNKGIAADDLRLDVSWTFVEGEHRIGTMKVVLAWAIVIGGAVAEGDPRGERLRRAQDFESWD